MEILPSVTGLRNHSENTDLAEEFPATTTFPPLLCGEIRVISFGKLKNCNEHPVFS
jgi:hypothetical protein